MGFNFKFTDLLASIGSAQMQRVPVRVNHLKEVYARYLDAIDEFAFLSPIPIDIRAGELPLYAEFACPEREKLVEYLNSENIQSRPVPPNLEGSSYLGDQGSFPNSRRLGSEALYLPCGPEQPLQNVDRVIEVLRSFKG
jgi:dTDP-4-amino-4,6-dideoxygalactose transaminase